MDDIAKEEKGEEQKKPEGEPEAKPEPPKIDPEVEKKAQVDALEAAKISLEAEVQRLRTEKRELKKAPEKEPEVEQIPVIDDTDPSAKAWTKRINETFSPVQKQVEQARTEVRQFAFDKFLADKPSLAKSPDKIKELMATYEKIRTASESTTEGVLLDLDKAYAATFHKELLDAARQGRIDDAKNSALFSDIAVSRGSTTYPSPKAPAIKLSDDEKAVLAKWGMTESDWGKMKAEIKDQ